MIRDRINIKLTNLPLPTLFPSILQMIEKLLFYCDVFNPNRYLSVAYSMSEFI